MTALLDLRQPAARRRRSRTPTRCRTVAALARAAGDAARRPGPGRGGAAAPDGPTRWRTRTHGTPRTVLISGGKMTKALQLARSFHSAGHRVVLVESAKYRFTGHRFSRAVDAFHCVPEPTAPGLRRGAARHRASLSASTCSSRCPARRPACHDARARASCSRRLRRRARRRRHGRGARRQGRVLPHRSVSGPAGARLPSDHRRAAGRGLRLPGGPQLHPEAASPTTRSAGWTSPRCRR